MSAKKEKKYSSLFAANFAIFILMAVVSVMLILGILVPRYIHGVVEEHSAKVIEYIESDAQYSLLVGNNEALEGYTDTIGELPWISSVSIANQNFDSVYTIGTSSLKNTPSMYGEGITHWIEGGQIHATKIVQIGERDGPNIVGGYLHVGVDKKHVDYAVMGVLLVVVLSIMLSAIVMVPGYRRASKKVVRPVVELSEAIKNTRNKDGRYQRISLVKAPREISDVVAVVNEFVDAANEQNKLLEAEVKRRTNELETVVKKLTLSENFRSSMMMNSSHDLRSPLTSLIGFIDMAREYTGEGSFDKVLESLDIAHGASLNIQEQIETFLVYMGDENDDKKSEDSISVDALVHRVLHQLNATAIRSGNKATYIHSGPNSIKVDKPKLERVLHGLISNAYNYCSDGEVKIRTIVDEELRITVEDTGVGMDADRLESIFKKNETGGESAHSGHRGVGIGLSMCAGWIDTMDGSINVESIKGVMTKFTVDIPVAVHEKIG